ncbi:WxcM-like domain-containing protein [Arthrobacter alkaliphilus]|uniref:WxcM-like domain-containing protein n=1 Tax=Arthrobacter alkaliphilus TaxID=369936 RepID=UPI001F2CCEEA|nr:WxcM-like domain-containing protein [Arthrobacter alkaliphilus]
MTFVSDNREAETVSKDGNLRTVIEAGATVGGGSVIAKGVRVGRNAAVCDGAVVTRDVPPFAIVSGNPAAISGYSDAAGRRLTSSEAQRHQKDAVESESTGGRIVHLRKATDLRGSLVVAELGSDLPFVPQRFFIVYDVPSLDVRGEHAHLACEQFLVCVKGSVHAIVDDGSVREEFLLDSANVGLYMPAMTWGTQYAYSSDAVLAVFASLPYDASDYIRSYEAFQREVSQRSSSSRL